MIIAQSKMATRSQMKKLMEERVPVEERVKSVYIPTILTDNVCFLSEHIIQVIKSYKCREAGTIVKRMKKIIAGYRSLNMVAMHEGLYGIVNEASEDFFQFIHGHLIIDQCTYTQELWKQYPNVYSQSASVVLAYVYFTKKIVEYIIQYERDYSRKTQEYLGNEVRYVAHDNQTCVAILKCLNDLVQIFQGPDKLEGYHIQMSYLIFLNRVKAIDVTSILNNGE